MMSIVLRYSLHKGAIAEPVQRTLLYTAQINPAGDVNLNWVGPHVSQRSLQKSILVGIYICCTLVQVYLDHAMFMLSLCTVFGHALCHIEA
jgi:hypothetical protein